MSCGAITAVTTAWPGTISAVLSHRPTIVFVHDQLGPGSTYLVRDLTLRNPALAVLVVSSNSDAETYSAALDAGARGLLTYPFSLEDVNHRLAYVMEWSQRIRAVIYDSPEGPNARATRGARVIAVARGKGGVGATVDLDVEKGDIPSYLDVSHRVSVADLSKISEDLTARAVADTVVVHSSGLHLLLAPDEIRDTDYLTPAAVRRILARRLAPLGLLRSTFAQWPSPTAELTLQ
jgi:pilus assembly protein CpaE